MKFADKKGRSELGLRDYGAIFLKRKWSILFIALIAVGVGAIRVSSMRPVYRATVQVLIDRQRPRVLSFEDVSAASSPFDYEREYYETQFRILESRTLVREVIEKEGLVGSPEFQPLPPRGFGVFLRERLRGYAEVPPLKEVFRRLQGLWEGSGAKALWASLRASRQEGAEVPAPEGPAPEGVEADGAADGLVDLYLEKLSIDPVKNSNLVHIHYEGFHPEVIATIANAHAEGYIRQSLSLRASTSIEAADWLNAQLEDVRKNLRDSEQTLLEYMEQNELVTLSGEGTTTEERLQKLNTSFAEARSQRIELEGLFQKISEAQGDPARLDTLSIIADNTVIQNLRKEHLETETEIARLSQKYKEGHPQIVRLRRKLDLVGERLGEERQKVISGLKIQLDIARTREGAFAAALEEQNREAISSNKKTTQYDILNREVTSNRELYETLLGRLKEINLTGGLQTTNIRIVDRAEVPESPVRPNKRLTLTMSLMLGLMFGFGLTLLREQLDTNIRFPADVERYLDVPFLGYLGRLDKRRGGDLVALTELRSTHAEALKTIRTNILYSPSGRGAQVLALTSPNPEEGKTLLAANLAISMAQAGRRVLLIDADMRKPRLHRLFHLSNKVGLKDVLEERVSWESVLQGGGHPNLLVLTSGSLAQNPSELLGSLAMGKFLEGVRRRFDRVLFDLSPLMAVTDPFVVAGMVDGVLLVAKSGWTSAHALQSVVERLKELHPEAAFQEVPGEASGSGPRILGIIINQVSFKRRPYYYQGYYYDYRYRYAQGVGKGGEPIPVRALPAAEETPSPAPKMPEEPKAPVESAPPKDLDMWILSSRPEETPTQKRQAGKVERDLERWVFSPRQETPFQGQAGEQEMAVPVWEVPVRETVKPEQGDLEDWVLTPRPGSSMPLHEAKESWEGPSHLPLPKGPKPRSKKVDLKDWEKLLLLDRDDEASGKK